MHEYPERMKIFISDLPGKMEQKYNEFVEHLNSEYMNYRIIDVQYSTLGDPDSADFSLMVRYTCGDPRGSST